MSNKDVDMEIGLGMTYDPGGAEAASADIERLKESAKELPQNSGAPTAAPPAQGEKDLAAAQQTAADAATRATQATIALFEARTQGKAAAEQASAAEQELAQSLQQQAAAAGEAAAAGQMLQQEAAEREKAAAAADKQMERLQAMREEMEAEAAEEATLREELAKLTQQRQAAAAAGDVEAYATAKAGEEKVRHALATKQQEAAQAKACRMAELEQMSVDRLREHIRALKKARDEAKARGNDEEYAALGKEIAEAGQQMGRLTAEINLSEAAANAHITACLQLGQAMSSAVGSQTLGAWAQLGNSMNGAYNTLQMTKGAMQSFGVTSKLAMAGAMGGVGLLLVGLQLLDQWLQKEEAAQQQALQEAQQYNAVLEENIRRWQDSCKAAREFDLSTAKKQLSDAAEEAARLRDETERAAAQEDARQQQAAEARLQAATAARDAALQQVELAEEAGLYSAQQAETERRLAEDAYREEAAAVAKAEDERTQRAADGAKERAETEVASLQEAYDKFQGRYGEVLKVQLPTEAELAALHHAEEIAVDEVQEEAAERATKAAMKQVDAVKDELRKMGIEVSGGYLEVMRYVEQLRELQKSNREQLESKQKEAADLAAAADLRAQQNETARKQREAEDEALVAARKIKDAQLARAAAEADWLQVSRRGYAEQQEFVQRQMAALGEGTEEYRRWADRLQQVTASMQEQEWAAVQRRGAEEQEHWLQQLLAAMQKGTLEYERWAERLQQVQVEKVRLSMEELAKTTKTAGSYASRDTRTQREILEADGAALAERHRRLQELKRTPGLDAGTMRNINRELEATQAEQRGLKLAVAANRKEAQKWLRELKPPKFQAKIKMAQTGLNRLAKQYENMAANAKKAAGKGDLSGVQRWMKSAGRVAVAMDRLQGQNGKALQYHKEVNDHMLAAVKPAAELARQRKAAAGHARRETAAAKRGADAAAKTAAEARQTAPAHKAADMTAQVTSMRNSLQAMETQLQQLTEAVGELANQATAVATAAGNAVTAARNAQRGLRTRVANLEKAVDMIRRQV